jgi:hypothetical protein
MGRHAEWRGTFGGDGGAKSGNASEYTLLPIHSFIYGRIELEGVGEGVKSHPSRNTMWNECPFRGVDDLHLWLHPSSSANFRPTKQVLPKVMSSVSLPRVTAQVYAVSYHLDI